MRDWFDELHASRGVDMNGPMAFSYPMIDSWARLTGRNPSPQEVEGLFTMDETARAALQSKA